MTVDDLRSNAIKCRDLASTALTERAREILAGLADEYEQSAAALESVVVVRPLRPAFRWPLSER